MIDSHVHLNDKQFAPDIDEVIERATAAGVTKMVNIGVDLASSRETVTLTERYSTVFGAVGVHPHDAKTYTDETEAELEEMLAKPSIIAVGEIGLDFYRDLSPRDFQRDVFRRQIHLARRARMPIIIHCRDAFEETIALLQEEGGPYTGIFHAFSGDRKMAQSVLDLGFHIGIGGVVTFRNSTLSEVVAGLPLESVVLETDCPYLTPMPYRGKRNEPGYVQFVADKISEVTGEAVASIIERTDQNFHHAMGLEH